MHVYYLLISTYLIIARLLLYMNNNRKRSFAHSINYLMYFFNNNTFYLNKFIHSLIIRKNVYVLWHQYYIIY